MSDKLILQNETVTSVCIEEAAASARCETARFDALHEQLLQLASISESSSEKEKYDKLEIDRTKQHAFAKHHINMHTDCIERWHYLALSLIAAPAEAVSESMVKPRHCGVHSGPSCKPQQEGDIKTAKQPQPTASPTERENIHNHARWHTFVASHVNAPTGSVEQAHSLAPSLIAAPTENVRGPVVQPRHDGAHPGPFCKPRQEGDIGAAKHSQYIAPTPTRERTYDVWPDVIPVAKSHQAVYHDTVISRPRYDGNPRSSHAPVTHSVAKMHATALYESGFAAYCLSMSRLVIDAQITDEVSDRYDCALIDNQSPEVSAYAPVEKHVGPIRTRRKVSCTGKDRVEGVAHSTSSRVKSAAAYAPSMGAAPACRQSSAEDVASHGEATPWRLHYIFRSWNGDPSIELVQDRASFDRTDRAGRLMVSVTANNNEVSAAARRKIERALARDDAPAELAGATLTPVRGVTA